MKILLFLIGFIFLVNFNCFAVFSSQTEFLEALNKAGYNEVIHLPSSIVQMHLSVYDLKKEKDHEKNRAYPSSLIKNKTAVESKMLSYYLDKKQKFPFVAFNVNNSLVCYLKHVPVSAFALTTYKKNQRNLSKYWDHCIVFPTPINEVIDSLK